jgi:hypothetical protein
VALCVYVVGVWLCMYLCGYGGVCVCLCVVCVWFVCGLCVVGVAGWCVDVRVRLRCDGLGLVAVAWTRV